MTRSHFVVAVVALSPLVACKRDEAAPAPAVVASAAASPKPMASILAPKPDGPFEGELQLVAFDSSGKQLSSATYDIKGPKIRYTATPVGGTKPAATAAIADTSQPKALEVMDQDKTYVEVATNAPPKASAKPARAPVVSHLAKNETIAGVECENWHISTSSEEVDVCAAKNIAFFDMSKDLTTPGVQPDWAQALAKENAFPLRVLAKDHAGKEEFHTTTTKVERKKMDDGLFQPPAGYKRTTPTKGTQGLSFP